MKLHVHTLRGEIEHVTTNNFVCEIRVTSQPIWVKNIGHLTLIPTRIFNHDFNDENILTKFAADYLCVNFYKFGLPPSCHSESRNVKSYLKVLAFRGENLLNGKFHSEHKTWVKRFFLKIQLLSPVACKTISGSFRSLLRKLSVMVNV